MTDQHERQPMGDPEITTPGKVQRIKVGIVEGMAFISKFAVLFGLLVLFNGLPLWGAVLLWAAGAVATHVWLFRGISRPSGDKPSMADLASYGRDSGIPLMVLGWPISTALIIVPDFIQHSLERSLGIQWRNGVRTFN